MLNSPDSRALATFRLRGLGGLALVASIGAAAGQQRRRLALLALLASGRERGITRDRLVSLLSPESSTESARHSLHQLLYYLRQQLGDDAFLGSDPLRLNTAVISSDVLEFEDAIERGELARAAALYGGPFLDGFHLNVAPFEDWVASERLRLTTMHAEAIRELACESEAAGDRSAATKWWRQLATLDPLSGSAALGLMRALAASGDASAALRHARDHTAMLRAELGERPTPEVEAFAARLHASTREAASSEEATAIVGDRKAIGHRADSDGDPPSPLSPSIAADRPARPSRRLFVAIGAGLGLTVVGLLTLRSAAPSSRPNAPTSGDAAGTGPLPVQHVHRLALLPFRSTGGDSSARLVAAGVTREMISALTRDGVPVIGYQSVAGYTTPGAPLREIAGTLGVDAIATGTLVRDGRRIELALEVADPSGKNLWVSSTRVDSANIASLADDAARTLGGWIRGGTIVSGHRRAGARTVASAEAYTNYLLAMQAALRGTSTSMTGALDLFESAIVADSNFALPRAGLGMALTIAVDYGILPADEAYRRAAPMIASSLALDSSLALAHLARARLLQLRDWDWKGAEAEYRRAIALEPNAQSYQTYGWFLEWYVGRAAEGVAMGERAVELDPGSPSAHNALAWRLRGAGQLDKAATEARIALALDSAAIDGYWILAEVFLRRGQLAEAEQSARRYIRAGGDVPANSTTLGEILARTGRRSEASAYAGRLALLATRDGPSLVALARTEMALGRHDHALVLLDSAVRVHVFTIPFQPYWDPIRSDPRFRAVLRAQGLDSPGLGAPQSSRQ
jgi:DNA-binding SARP family transcriptional activator/TolB-like protein/Tfp pilus assembly protein PilF